MKLSDFNNIIPEIEVLRDCEIDKFWLMGKPSIQKGRLLYFMESEAYKESLLAENPSAIICTAEIASKVMDSFKGGVCIADQPRGTFFYLYNELSKKNLEKQKWHKTVIGKDVEIDVTAQIAEFGVTIGDRVKIGASTVISCGTTIGNDVNIGDNCAIGVQPQYYFKYQGKRHLLEGEGAAIIGDNVIINSGCRVDRGVLDSETMIGNDSLIMWSVLICHNSLIGSDCSIMAGTSLAGWVKLGDNVYIGMHSVISPSVVIESDAYVCLGSAVIRNVQKNAKVLGNPAREIDRNKGSK